jgi:hypothetical protein
MDQKTDEPLDNEPGRTSSAVKSPKGGDYARQVFEDDDRDRRGRCQRRYIGVGHTDVGSGSSGFRHRADAVLSAENTLG